MKVAIIKHGMVDRIVELSTLKHPTISNFSKLPISKLLEHGIYPIVEDYVEYDATYQQLETVHVIEPGRVHISKSIVDRPVELVRNSALELIKQKVKDLMLLGFTTSSGIKMDSTYDSVQLLDSGYQLAVRSGLTELSVRDYTNTSHPSIPIADVNVMILELAGYVSQILADKWTHQDLINSALTPLDVKTAGDAALNAIQLKMDAIV